MPIEFTCPHCGAKTNVADQYVGHTGPCGSCGQTITVPGTPTSNYAPPPTRGGGGGLGIVLIVLFGGVLVFGILISLLLPAIQAAREAARRAACINNMKQIGLALHNYNDEYGCFPPPYTVDKDGNKLHSWRVLILPYLEEEFLYKQIHLDEPWNSPHNMVFNEMMPSIFRCPSNPAGPEASQTDYLMITGPGTVGDNPKGTKLREIRDGTSNTAVVAESADSGVNWMQPVDFDITTMPRAVAARGEAMSRGAISSYHPGVANILFCDGHVVSVSTEIDPDVMEAILTKDDGEAVNLEY